jgi:ABC-type uncharacterized transport system permease subunit
VTDTERDRFGFAGLIQTRREILVELAPILSLLLAFGVIGLMIAAIGVNPFSALRVLFLESVGSINGLGATFIKLTPLLIAGLGIAIGVRCGMWNLGAEGQIYMGGLFATVTALYLVPSSPGPVQMASCLVGGFLGGGAWALFPAFLRVTKGVNELITTLLMNFVAINIVTILVQGPLGEEGASFPRSPAISPDAYLPILVKGTQMHVGLVIALILAAIVYVLLSRTSFGLELRAIGGGERAARFTGISVRRRMVQALVLSGSLAGIAGAVEILGLHHRLTQRFSPGFGFDAIAVALLGAADPRWMIFVAMFFAMLRTGAPAMERSLGIPFDLVFVTQGLALVSIVFGYGLRDYLRRHRPKGKEPQRGVSEVQDVSY